MSNDKKYRIEGDTLIINDGVTTIKNIDFHTYDKNGEYEGVKDEVARIKKVIIPDSVTNIRKCAFYYFENLTSVTIPDSVTSIGYAAFCGCKSLTSITIPDSVTSIGEYAFKKCKNLKNITLPNNITYIGKVTFYDCKSLESIIIPDGVTSIGRDAFRDCENLEDISLPDSVTDIGYSAFSGCKSLTDITIPDSVTSIGGWAFAYCESLESITIPSSVTSIGLHSFEECDNLIIKCAKGSYAEKFIKETERTPAKPIKSGDIVQLTNFDNLYGMVSGMNEDHIFVLDCNGDERRVKRSEGSVLKPVKSSPAIKKAFCEMLDQIEMRQQIRDDIYNLQGQESEYDSKIADNTTLLRSLLSEKGKNNRDIER